jgi:1-acyl-sn-glycerol-3-phosphate acyltransferase
MRWYFEYLWRLFGTALSFVVFGIGGLVYGLLIFPLVFVFVRDRQARRVLARRFIGKGFGAFLGLMKWVNVVDIQVEGREYIDDQRRQLIIANHPTLIDVVILISLFPQANCVIKQAVTLNPFMRSTVRAADYISNSEPEELLESCVDYLHGGKSLLLFPEGTRTRHDEPINFKPGAATVAARTKVDILPIAIECRPLYLSKQLPWHYVPRDVPMFTIRVLPPRGVSDLVPAEMDDRQFRHTLNDALLDLVNNELADMEFCRKPNYNT